ncbi:MAG: hypothetical protein ABL876_00215 [Chitinophagaceae bacterium]
MSSAEERLRTLETQQRLFNASVKGGAIVAYTDNLVQIVRMGRIGYSSASVPIISDGFAVSDDAGTSFHFLMDSHRGWVVPSMPITFVKEDNFAVNSALGPLSAWKATITILSDVLVVRVVAYPDSGIVGTIWLDIDSGPDTNHATISTGGGQLVEFLWDISSFGYAYGSVHILRLWGDITSGSGNMLIVNPDLCAFGILEDFPAADANGNV